MVIFFLDRKGPRKIAVRLKSQEPEAGEAGRPQRRSHEEERFSNGPKGQESRITRPHYQVLLGKVGKKQLKYMKL